MLRTAVIDIEGTTSATDFVTGRLYSYSADRFASWLTDHELDPDTVRVVAQVRALIGEPSAGPDRIVASLIDWLGSDQKITPLKTLQGLIWAQGFASGDLVAHFYPDAIPALRAWKSAGRRLYVFSSGSVTAQRAWFGHSAEGDLRPLISGYFDTENAGPKKQAGSYRSIASAIGADPAQVVFVSDLVAELDAARLAGWHTVRVRRPAEKNSAERSGGHLEVGSLAELDLSGDRPAASG